MGQLSARAERRKARAAAAAETKELRRQVAATGDASKLAGQAAKLAAAEADKAAKAAARGVGLLDAAKAKELAVTSAAAQKQAALYAETARKAAKEAAKSEKAAAAKARKAEHKVEQEKATMVAQAQAKANRKGLVGSLADPAFAKRLVTVGKILVPVLAPFALRAATSARGLLDRTRADQLGVPVDRVSEFTGPTARTGARIDGLQRAVAELRRRPASDAAAQALIRRADGELTDLEAATRAAASLPAPRRQVALDLIGTQLDALDSELLSVLVHARR